MFEHGALRKTLEVFTVRIHKSSILDTEVGQKLRALLQQFLQYYSRNFFESVQLYRVQLEPDTAGRQFLEKLFCHIGTVAKVDFFHFFESEVPLQTLICDTLEVGT